MKFSDRPSAGFGAAYDCGIYPNGSLPGHQFFCFGVSGCTDAGNCNAAFRLRAIGAGCEFCAIGGQHCGGINRRFCKKAGKAKGGPVNGSQTHAGGTAA